MKLLLSPDVIKLHHINRIFDTTIGTGFGLDLLNDGAQHCSMLTHVFAFVSIVTLTVFVGHGLASLDRYL